MKLKIIVVLIIVLALASMQTVAFADVMEDLEEEVSEGLDSIDFSQVDEVSDQYVGSVQDKIWAIINGDFDSAESFLSFLTALLADGLKSVLPQLTVIFAVIVVMGLIRKTSGGMISDGTNEVVTFVGITVVITCVLSLIVSSYRQVYNTLAQIGALCETAAPILLTLLIANGGNVASTVCQPSMVMFSTVVIRLVQTVALPLSVFALVFSSVSNISSNIRVEKTASFLSGASNWLLGCLFMFYSAFTSVQGITAASIDGVSYRAAKFAAKSYIPILGGYLADGFDVVVAGASLIKNAFGAVTLAVLFFMVAEPLVSVICVNLGLQCVSAICEPVADKKYIKILSALCKSLTFLSVLVLAVAFMFCILVLIAISCANAV